MSQITVEYSQVPADLHLRLLPLGEPPMLPAEEMALMLEKFQGHSANAQKAVDILPSPLAPKETRS